MKPTFTAVKKAATKVALKDMAIKLAAGYIVMKANDKWVKAELKRKHNKKMEEWEKELNETEKLEWEKEKLEWENEQQEFEKEFNKRIKSINEGIEKLKEQEERIEKTIAECKIEQAIESTKEEITKEIALVKEKVEQEINDWETNQQAKN